ncbi:MAG: filamentous hemagglutinin family protein [Methylophilaceae bacterium]
MNRNIYRLVQDQDGRWVPVAEHVKGRGKGQGTMRRARVALLVAASIMPGLAWSAGSMPVPSAGTGGIPAFVGNGAAAWNAIKNANGSYSGFVSQVGSSAVLNWKQFNVGSGNSVVFQQVNNLTDQQLVQGATFSTLNRIWDANPSVIAGQISVAAGQKGNLTFINTNGIIFANGAQVDANTLTASSLQLGSAFEKNLFYSSSTTNPNVNPQFTGTTGFVKVLEGARISAASGGRVMLIAPTVTNRGSIDAPDGQAILAAGTKVYLEASSNPDVRGLLVEVDSGVLNSYNTANNDVKPGELDTNNNRPLTDTFDNLGNVTNLGSISVGHGNATMVGLAVNQMNAVNATTSVLFNGSIYLKATNNFKDVSADGTGIIVAKETGRVRLGAGSQTTILPDAQDATTSKDDQTFNKSKVQIVGKEIQLEQNAKITAPAGEVNLYAVANPSELQFLNKLKDTDFFDSTASAALNAQASISIATGAVIDVAGMDYIKKAESNFLTITLRGDELKDSPLNRDGQLRGQTVTIDLSKDSPLIANLADYKANIQRTVGERSTAAGTVNLKSEGSVLVDKDAVIDVHGGTVKYEQGQVKVTKLWGADGKTYDISKAPKDISYTGIAGQWTKVYTKWGVTKVFDSGQLTNIAGYTVGKDAGTLVMNTNQGYFNGLVKGKTTLGDNLALQGKVPLGALLQVGGQKQNTSKVVEAYGLSQNLIIGAAPSASVRGIGAPLSADEQANFRLDAGLFGGDGFSRVEAYTNKNLTIDKALTLNAGGSFTAIAAGSINVNANTQITSGDISMSALQLTVANNVKISTAGGWINDFAAGQVSNLPQFINAGKLTLGGELRVAGNKVGANTSLGQNALLDVRGGGYLGTDKKLIAGNGGNLTLGARDLQFSGALQDHITAAALGTGGTVDVTATEVQIGGAAPTGVLGLNSGFFSQGFSAYNVTGRVGLTVADNTQLKVQTHSLELLPNAPTSQTGTPISQISRTVLLPDQTRKAANLSLTTSFLTDSSERHHLAIGSGAVINTDPGAKVDITSSGSLDIYGTVRAPAGVINLTGNKEALGTSAERVYLGNNAIIDVSGVAKVYPSAQGRFTGDVLNGGSVKIDGGYFTSEAGALIDVHGAAPQAMDIVGATGLVRQNIASDAGSVSISGKEGIFADNRFNAAGGSATTRGGAVTFSIGDANATTGKVAHIGEFGSVVQSGVLPAPAVGQAYVDLPDLLNAGFEKVTVRSSNTISVDGSFTAGGSLKLQALQLDAPLITSNGGNATLQAAIIQAGNFNPSLQSNAYATNSGTGSLTLQAGGNGVTGLLELAGNTKYSNLAQLNLNSTGEIRLTGAQGTSKLRSTGLLDTQARVDLTAAVVTPSTLSDFTLNSPNQTIAFHKYGNPTNPISVLGSLTVNAKDIQQDGSIIAPFGKISLNADNNLSLGDGSLTSVTSPANLVLPFGKVANGKDWYIPLTADGTFDSDSQKISSLESKSVKLNGKSVALNSGAKVDISGGGDVQAWEFSPGPGGSADYLATPGVYAILPGYQGVAAPVDQGSAATGSGFDLAIGKSVYLDGSTGVPKGVYTLLPAHYALLPGAYAISLTNGTKDLQSGQGRAKVDGTQIIPGFLTDSRYARTGQRDARWTGFQVLSRDEVQKRSTLTLYQASSFFPKQGVNTNLPASAGQFSIKTQTDLLLAGDLVSTAATGGKGAQVDISAPKIAVTSSNTTPIEVGAVRLDVAKLNALKADSLLIGATRTTVTDSTTNATTTTLDVGANSVTLTNDAANPLQGSEVMLASTDKLNIAANSAITADGTKGDAGSYSIVGDGALVRVAATDATLNRTGATRTLGTLNVGTGTQLTSSRAVLLDATKATNFDGNFTFTQPGVLSLGATRMSFGDTTGQGPQDKGIIFTPAKLAQFNGLESLKLQSYSTFDFYGPSSLGGVDANGNQQLGSLVLEGGGIVGYAAANQTATIAAKSLQLNNTSAASFNLGTTSGGTAPVTGSGDLAIVTDTLTLGAGDKTIAGFSKTTATANEVVGQGSGSLNVQGNADISTARISGGVDQSINATGVLNANSKTSSQTLANVTGLASKWALSGAALNFDTKAVLPSGQLSLTATTGDLNVNVNALLDAAGRAKDFFDTSKSTYGGNVKLASASGNINVALGATVDVSGAAGADAGTLSIVAANGKATLNGVFHAATPVDADGKQGKGGEVELDVNALNNPTDFSQKLAALNEFSGKQDYRVRTGDVSIAAADSVKTQHFVLSADAGAITVSGKVDASGDNGGIIEMYAKNDLTLKAGSQLIARGLADDNGAGSPGNGGAVLLSSDTGTVSAEVFAADGITRLANAAGKTTLIDVSGKTVGSAKGEGGQVIFRADRTAGVDNSAFTFTGGTLTILPVQYSATVTGVSPSETPNGNGLFFFTANSTASSIPSLDVNSTGAKSLLTPVGDTAGVGSLVASTKYLAVYKSGVGYQLVPTISGTPSTVTVATGSNALVMTTAPAGFTLTRGQMVTFKPTTTGTATAAGATLKVGSNAAIAIKFNGAAGNASSQYFRSTDSYLAIYDGTNFVVVNTTTTNNASVAAGKDFTATAGLGAGTTYTTGTIVTFKLGAAATSTSQATLKVNSLNAGSGVTRAARNLKFGTTVAKGSDFNTTDTYVAYYDGTDFQVLGASASTTVTTSAAPTELALTGSTPAAGTVVPFQLTSTSTGPMTLKVNGISGALLNNNGSAIASGSLGAGNYLAVFDGSKFNLLPGTGSGTSPVDSGVNVAKATTGAVTGADRVQIEAVKNYNQSTLDSSFQSKVASETQVYAALAPAILGGFAQTQDGKTATLSAGVEVRSAGSNMTIANDWSLQGANPSGGAGFLTLRTDKNLLVNGSLSDGFSTATTAGTLTGGNSWSYRLAAGADLSSANLLAVNRNKTGDFTLANSKLIRTGNGSIDIATGGKLILADQTSVIYTAGTPAAGLSDFVVPKINNVNAMYSEKGGDINIKVKGDIIGAVTNQLYTNWLFRQGQVDATTGVFDADSPQTSWWVNFGTFQQGIGALGGGNVNVNADGNIKDLSVSSVANGRMNVALGFAPQADKLVIVGGGDVNVHAAGDVGGGQYYAERGQLNLRADGSIAGGSQTLDGKAFGTVIALGDAQANITAGKDLTLQAVINPNLVAQSFGVGLNVPTPSNYVPATPYNDIGIGAANLSPYSYFSTMTDKSALNLQSLTGNVTLENSIGAKPTIALPNATPYNNSAISWRFNDYKMDVALYPGSLNAVAYQGDITVNRPVKMLPAAKGELNLLAYNNVQLNAGLTMSDQDVSTMPLATQTPLSKSSDTIISDVAHALTPVHQNDTSPVKIYAVNGDISGKKAAVGTKPAGVNQLTLPKAARFMAGRDFTDLSLFGQNLRASDVTYIKAGRDFNYSNAAAYSFNFIDLKGPGRLEVEAGRDMNLGDSVGIATTGNAANLALPSGGANIQIAVGVPSGVDYQGAVNRLIAALDNAISTGATLSDATLWQARWLIGNTGAASQPQALKTAVQGLQAQGAEVVHERVRSMFYQALRDTGRDHNNADSPYVGQYDRGYQTIELLFPGVDAKNANGSSKNYNGNLNMFLSAITTKNDGDIEFMAPGGQVFAGLQQIPAVSASRSASLGIVAANKGAIRGFSRNDILVNQSRILTVAGGDVLLWSSEGDIDAGKGKKTASVVPPPEVTVDPTSGAVTVKLKGAASGSGIGALELPPNKAGDVDLIAPKGTVNAGDAGIRAGNINIAAQVVIGADNITASGTSSGVPVADTGAIGGAAASAGASSDATKSAVQDVAKQLASNNTVATAPPVLPSFITVEVIGLGI